jgi:SsrA-binding protein
MNTFATRKKATFDFEILDTFEAGLVLSGNEVKSIRSKKAKLEGAYVVIRGDEAFILGFHVPPYQASNVPKGYEPDRTRKLLLSKKEIALLDQKTNVENLTIVPLRLYNSGRKIKLEIAVARGKKKTDKRETIKKRDTKRDIERTLKNQY